MTAYSRPVRNDLVHNLSAIAKFLDNNGDVHHISLTPDKQLSIVGYMDRLSKSSYRSYKLLKSLVYGSPCTYNVVKHGISVSKQASLFAQLTNKNTYNIE